MWALVLAAGAALLYARYDWSVAGGFFAKRGFVLSLYLFVILLPTVYYLLLRTMHSRRWAIGLSAAAFVVFTLPYELLSLDSIYYYATHPLFYGPATAEAGAGAVGVVTPFPTPKLEFLPGGALNAFPFAWLYMPLLFGLGASCVWFVWWVRARGGFRVGRRLPLLLTAAFAVICLQAFFHSSMRAPYTYDSHFELPQAAHRWYVVYHFANGTGATIGDNYLYSPLEDYFQGAPRSGLNDLIRRPFSFYVASQFSYFFNTFYAWLALNCLFWLAAVFATARLVTRLTDRRVGLIAGALTVFGSGFVAFVGTPAMYMQTYAAAAIALCAFEDLVARPIDGRRRQYGLFLGVLALCALVYDLEPLFVVLLAYGLARRVPWRPLVASLVGALVIAESFPLLVTKILGIPIDAGNSGVIGQSIRAVLHLISHPHLSTWYDTFISVMSTFVQMWLHAFFIIPAVLAIIGWRFLRDRPQQVLVGTLFLVQFLTMALFYIGGTSIAHTPRVLYPYFIGVYLPAALAIDRLGTWLGRRLAPRRVAGLAVGHATVGEVTARAAPWAVIAVMAFLANIDIFGHPSLYIEYFVNTPPLHLPPH
jgi:hypothetical protein